MFNKLFNIIFILILIVTSQVVSADSRVKAVQEKLSELGYKPGVADGLWGAKTQAALEKFLSSKGQVFDGLLDENELKLLAIENVRCAAKPQPRFGRRLGKSWSEEVTCPAEVFVAADLKYQTKFEIEKTLDAGASEWGNYGPVEYWVLGTDKRAALDLAKQFCKRRAARGDWDYNSCYNQQTKDSDHGYMYYYDVGKTALTTGQASTSMGHNGGMEWGIHNFTSSLPLGFEKKLGISGGEEQKTVLHEYFHALQHAHVRSLNDKERDKLLGPVWFMEGAAEYMASVTHYKLVNQGKLPLLQNDNPGSMFIRNMRHKFELAQQMNKRLDCVSQMPGATYTSPCREFFYDGGAWAIAYLLAKTEQDILITDFYPNLSKRGWEKSFHETFGLTSSEFYEEFSEFLSKGPSSALRLLPFYK